MSYPAESYEKYSVPALFAPWSSHLIRSANPQPGEHALDVACGTGIISRSIAPLVGLEGTVIGLDLKPAMLNVARTAAEREGLSIEWSASRAEQIPFRDGSFDLVFCQFGLMFFTDRHTALTEMQRVLRSGGRVILSVWQGLHRHPFYQTLHEVSRRHFGKSSVEDVFSLGDPDELYELVIEAGFQQVRVEPVSITVRYPNPPEFLAWEMDVDPATAPALQHLDPQAQQAVLTAVREEIQVALREVMQDGQIALLSHAHVAHATK